MEIKCSRNKIDKLYCRIIYSIHNVNITLNYIQPNTNNCMKLYIDLIYITILQNYSKYLRVILVNDSAFLFKVFSSQNCVFN